MTNTELESLNESLKSLKTSRLMNLCKNICIFNPLMNFYDGNTCTELSLTYDNFGRTAILFESKEKSKRKRYLLILKKLIDRHFPLSEQFSCIEDYILKLAIRGL